MRTRKPPPDDADQSVKFFAMVKEVEADKTGRAFIRAFGVVVPSPPLTAEPEKPKIGAPKAARKKAAGAISKG